MEGRVDDDSRLVMEGLERASEQSLRAGEIIRRLRDFVSRSETERRVESVTKLVEEASALALVGIKDANVRVFYDLDRDADLVLADKVQIQQVLVNLMRNAVEAMADSSTRDLKISSRQASADMILVKVTDSGAGISPDVAAHLFQPFFSTKSQGMGVGLSICRTIIEAHGGQISMEPNSNRGTTFAFTLRRVTGKDVDDGQTDDPHCRR